jgi:hypothetical protein
VQNILEVGCIPSKCTDAQFASMEQYRKAFVKTLAPVLAQKVESVVNALSHRLACTHTLTHIHSRSLALTYTGQWMLGGLVPDA